MGCNRLGNRDRRCCLARAGSRLFFKFSGFFFCLLPGARGCAGAKELVIFAGSALNPLGAAASPPCDVVCVRAFLRVAAVWTYPHFLPLLSRNRQLPLC